jgi:hypothetical protein
VSGIPCRETAGSSGDVSVTFLLTSLLEHQLLELPMPKMPQKLKQLVLLFRQALQMQPLLSLLQTQTLLPLLSSYRSDRSLPLKLQRRIKQLNSSFCLFLLLCPFGRSNYTSQSKMYS